MKKLLMTAAALACAMAFTVSAAEEKKKPALTDEQKKLMKEITETYDKNKDGKLDQEERAAISEADKKRMADAKLPGGPGKKKDKK